MNRLRAGLPRGGENLFKIEITFRRRVAADGHGFVRLRDMQRIRVRVGINRDGADAHFFERADNAAGNRATVGDQNFLEHKIIPPRRPPRSA